MIFLKIIFVCQPFGVTATWQHDSRTSEFQSFVKELLLVGYPISSWTRQDVLKKYMEKNNMWYMMCFYIMFIAKLEETFTDLMFMW